MYKVRIYPEQVELIDKHLCQAAWGKIPRSQAIRWAIDRAIERAKRRAEGYTTVPIELTDDEYCRLFRAVGIPYDNPYGRIAEVGEWLKERILAALEPTYEERLNSELDDLSK